MKRLINTALVYLIAGAAAGVFFREFTKLSGFSGQTVLGFMHPHLLALGFLVFLIATLFALASDFTGDRLFKPFFIVSFVKRAVLYVARKRGKTLTLFLILLVIATAALSGIAGIGHIMVGVGLVLLVIMFKRVVDRKAAAARA